MRTFPRLLLLALACVLGLPVAWGQQVVSGTVYDPEGSRLEGATIRQQGKDNNFTVSDAEGRFALKVKPEEGKKEAILIRFLGFTEKLVTLSRKGGDTLHLGRITLQAEPKEVKGVDVEGRQDPSLRQASMMTINPITAIRLPSPFGDFNRILATMPGVVSNNELSSQYTVRGGNFDENMVYVNDFEVYRPTLVRQGQQEGLSFVNPDLVESVEFSSGGWQPRFGDKLSSVLNVRYKQPKESAGSINLGLLSQSGHLETAFGKNKQFSWVAGVRRKSAQYLLAKSFFTPGSDVQGQYRPRFVDGQSMLTWQPTLKEGGALKSFKISLLTAIADNLYRVTPTEQQTDFGTVAAVLRLQVAFEGREILSYTTQQHGLNFSFNWRKFRSDLALSYVSTLERERNDLEGGYRLCDLQTDPGKDNFNNCIVVRGVGTNYNYARNGLSAQIESALSRNYLTLDSTFQLEFGLGMSHETVNDRLYEYSFVDSADYVSVTKPINTAANLSSYRIQPYIQNTTRLGRNIFTYGVRAQYWSLTQQFFASPRAQWAYKASADGKWILKAAAGLYQQPAFYRELRDRDGTLVKNLKAQRSYHFIVGSDVSLKMWNRPFRFISEGYYKYLDRIVPYDVENVRVRYLPRLQPGSRAYAYGADFRLSGEFIKGTESWFSLGLLSTREDIPGDSITEKGNKHARGFIRRPSDQRATFSVFFQDYLPRNPSWRVSLNLIIGTGLPFGPPGDTNLRALFRGPTYRRFDIGFAKVISLGDKSSKLGRHFKLIWIGLDVLNLIGANNTISYTWIKDVDNNQFAIPNYLSQRFFNLRVRVEF